MNQLSVSGMRPQFGRYLTGKEQLEYRHSVEKALRTLGKDRLALIAHAPAFPGSGPVGTPLSAEGKKFTRFVSGLGFNRLQFGPNGIITPFNPSPYNSSVFSRNPLLINLDELTEEHFWGSLLSKARLAELRKEFSPAVEGRTNYSQAFALYDTALREAFGNYHHRRTRAVSLGFEDFKRRNHDWLEKDGFYTVLSKIHGNDYWPNWPSELDRELFNPKSETISPAQARLRRQQLREEYRDELEYQRFVQFVAHWQWQQIRGVMRSGNILPMGDSPIAFSDRDVWANREIFLDDWRMGAPPDEFAADGQPWGFHVLNPDTLLRQHIIGKPTLGSGGRLLLAKFEKIFAENPGGIRIDHVIGLVDPWVYSEQAGFSNPERPPARLYSSPEDPDLRQYSHVLKDQIDESQPREAAHRVKSLDFEQVKHYATVLEIVKAAAEKQKVPIENIICEDIGGELTTPVKEALKATGLGGIRVSVFVDPNDQNDYKRLKNVEAPNWVSTGSHDNVPLLAWASEQIASGKAKDHAKQLAGDLLENNSLTTIMQGIWQQRAWKKDPAKLATAKLAELFASPAKSIQIFVNDLFGLTEPYNTPGTTGPQNWTQRVPQSFERFYHDQLIAGKAMNIPEVLAMALQARGENDGDLIQTLKSLAMALNAPETPPQGLRGKLARSA